MNELATICLLACEGASEMRSRRLRSGLTYSALVWLWTGDTVKAATQVIDVGINPRSRGAGGGYASAQIDPICLAKVGCTQNAELRSSGAVPG